MNDEQGEHRIRDLFQQLRRSDAARAPDFDRSVRVAAQRKPWWKTPLWPVGLGLAATGAAAAAAALLFVQVNGASAPAATASRWVAQQPRPEPLASMLHRPAGSPVRLDGNPIPKRRLLGGWE